MSPPRGVSGIGLRPPSSVTRSPNGRSKTYRLWVGIRTDEPMVLSLAAYVYASVTTPDHEFNGGFAFQMFVADVLIAAAVIPSPPLP